MRGEQAIFNLEIKKKSGLSINPDIHHSKVFSSAPIIQIVKELCILKINLQLYNDELLSTGELPLRRDYLALEGGGRTLPLPN